MTQNTIKIFISSEQASEEGPILLEGEPTQRVEKAKAIATDLPVATIKENLNAFVQSLGEIVPRADVEKTGFHLKSFNVAVGVNGKGEVGFLGTGVEFGATATLTLAFERK